MHGDIGGCASATEKDQIMQLDILYEIRLAARFRSANRISF